MEETGWSFTEQLEAGRGRGQTVRVGVTELSGMNYDHNWRNSLTHWYFNSGVEAGLEIWKLNVSFAVETKSLFCILFLFDNCCSLHRHDLPVQDFT